MITDKDIATLLLNRQNANFSFVLDGKTREKLTPDGFQFAMNRRWLEIDDSMQCICISRRTEKLAEINHAAFSTIGNPIGVAPQDQVVVVAESAAHDLVLAHVVETKASQSVDHIVERFENQPPVIGVPEPSWRKLDMFQQSSPMQAVMEDVPVPVGQQPPGQYKVGDPVVVAEGGETFPATVQALQPNGQVVLSFGDRKPRTMKQAYDPKEIGRGATDPSQPPPKPQTPAAPPTAAPPQVTSPSSSQVASGPPAPGVARR
jgi:hypothetical protein